MGLASGRVRALDWRRVPVVAMAFVVILVGCQNRVDRQDEPGAPTSSDGAGGRMRASPESYEHDGRRSQLLPTATGYRERGNVTHYVKEYQGMPTASGEPYESSGMTAAHRTLPLASHVRVTDLATGRSVVVRINDRGPFRDDRLIGLSWAAASQLGTLGRTAEVEVTGIEPEEAGPRLLPRTAPEGTLPPRPVPAATSVTGHQPQGTHSVQAGAFRDRSNADRLRARLSGAGLGTVRVAGGDTTDDGLYRVLLGPHPSRAAADRVAAALHQWGVTDPVIVAH